MALIYSKADKAAIDRAVAKARQIKPRVKVLGFGHFEVTGSEGQSYEVKFSKVEGEFVAECGCRANSKGNKPCYHTASVGSIFKLQVKDRAAERAALAPVEAQDFSDIMAAMPDLRTKFCGDCGAEYLAKFDNCPVCEANRALFG